MIFLATVVFPEPVPPAIPMTYISFRFKWDVVIALSSNTKLADLQHIVVTSVCLFHVTSLFFRYLWTEKNGSRAL